MIAVARIKYDGSWLICKIGDVHEYTFDLADDYEIEYFEMTEEEFEALPEFDGW